MIMHCYAFVKSKSITVDLGRLFIVLTVPKRCVTIKENIMGQVHMFNTFSNNLLVTVNSGSTTYSIRATNKSTDYTPSQAIVERGSPASGTTISNGPNTFSLQPVNNNSQPTGSPIAFLLTIPSDIDITDDLLIYFFQNKLMLLHPTGFVITIIAPS